MQRIETAERYNWREVAEELGFRFHSIDGDPYWFEGAYYSFTLRQVEDDLEEPSEELEEMCFAIVDKALQSEEIMTRLAIPERHWDYIVDSWVGKAKNLYGRMDFSYNGEGPAKFLEYNADTPTSLYEAGVFQWRWLEDLQADGRLPDTADQYNSIHETLIEAFQGFGLEGILPLTAEAASEEDVVVSLATGSWLWGDKIAVLPNHSGESSAVPVGVPPSAVLGDIGSFVLVLPPAYIVDCPLCSS